MIDKLYIKKSFIYNEFDEVENTYWFVLSKKSFFTILIHFIIPSSSKMILQMILRT